MDSVALYRTLDCGWVECGGIRLACTPEREQEVLRQVAWAKTFGLPLELICPEEAQELFPLMVTDGVRCASYLPTDGYLDPSQLTYALVDGAARRRRAGLHPHARDRNRRRPTGGVRGVQTEWGGSRPRSSSTRAACSPPRSAGWPACGCRSSRSRTSTSSRSRFASATPRRACTCRRCATPTCSSTSARRAAGW